MTTNMTQLRADLRVVYLNVWKIEAYASLLDLADKGVLHMGNMNTNTLGFMGPEEIVRLCAGQMDALERLLKATGAEAHGPLFSDIQKVG